MKDRPKALVSLSLAVLVALLAGGGWFWVGLHTADKFAQCRAGRSPLEPGTIGGPFALVGEAGETVTDADVLTGPALVYFGYTFCPDVCPLDMSRNADAIDLLDDSGHEVLPVFISVDPERDTSDVLRDWTANLHPRLLGLTGTPGQIAAVARDYKAFFRRQPNADEDFYLIDHSTFTYLSLPGRGVVDFFDRGTSAEEVAERTACYLDAA